MPKACGRSQSMVCIFSTTLVGKMIVLYLPETYTFLLLLGTIVEPKMYSAMCCFCRLYETGFASKLKRLEAIKMSKAKSLCLNMKGGQIMSLPGFAAEASLGNKISFYRTEDYGVQKISSNNHQIVPQLSLPFYGNWCGPGHGGGAAIDAVDAACRAHDHCYSQRGYSDCLCDRNLIKSMPDAVARTPTAKGKAAGVAIGAFFSQFPCICRKRACVKIPFIGKRCSTVPIPGRGGRC